MKHVMLDLKTMGNHHNSVIVSIGAVRFEPTTGEKGESSYRKIDFASCLKLGLEVNADTIEWWMQQNEVARMKVAKVKGTHISEVLVSFAKFIGKDDYIWGNSARFDIGILQNAYNKAEIDIPWDFKKELDVRTAMFFRQEIKAKVSWNGPAHDPIVDCNNQIDYVSKAYQSIMENFG